MKGTWGRRVYGSVKKGTKYTRFRLEMTLTNDCTFFETHLQSNESLEQYPALYGWTLDLLTDRLNKRVEARPQ